VSAAAEATAPAGARSATVRQAVSVGLSAGLYGVSFGALAVADGLSVLQACLLSLLLFTGGSQFALIGVLASGGSAAAAITSSSLLGVRNMLYGLQLTPTLGTRGLRRVAAAQVTIDETTAVSVSQPSLPLRRLGFWVTGAACFVVWNATTLVGALAGNAIGDPRRYGLDAAAAAAFLALLWPRLRSREPIAVAVAGALVAAALVPAVPAGLPVVAAAGAAIVVVLARGVRR
jgi:predicted branched-subunit amino acid permease